MDRVSEFFVEYVDDMPQAIAEGVIYISKIHEISIHLCACGCRGKVVMPLGPTEWQLVEENGLVSFTPSIGNFMPPPYHAHYFIKRNRVEWCEEPSKI